MADEEGSDPGETSPPEPPPEPQAEPEKKPEQKKPEQKKPASKKPATKKPDSKQSESESERPESKKSKRKITKPPSIYYDGILSFPRDREWAPDQFEKPQLDWQMSPFPKERFDLDEEQKLAQLGVKGAHKLAEFRKAREPPSKEEPPSFGPCPTCGSTCGKNCSSKRSGVVKHHASVKCPPRYMYQPYGPAPTPVSSISRAPASRNYSNYTPYGSSTFKTTLYSSEKLPPRRYPESVSLNKCSYFLAENVYMPYGPQPELKIQPLEYTPYGPSVLPTSFILL